MKKIILSFTSLVVLGANSLFAYNMYNIPPNIAAITSDQAIVQIYNDSGQIWDMVYYDSRTNYAHGGDALAAIDVFEVPSVVPDSIWIGSHMGHFNQSVSIKYNGYIIGYEHYYDFYNVSTGTSSELMEFHLDPNETEYDYITSDYLTVK